MLLARPGLALEQHGSIRRGGALYHGERRAHRDRARDDPVEFRLGRDRHAAHVLEEIESQRDRTDADQAARPQVRLDDAHPVDGRAVLAPEIADLGQRAIHHDFAAEPRDRAIVEPDVVALLRADRAAGGGRIPALRRRPLDDRYAEAGDRIRVEIAASSSWVPASYPSRAEAMAALGYHGARARSTPPAARLHDEVVDAPSISD